MQIHGRPATGLVLACVLMLAAPALAQDATVTFDPGTQYQEFDGFGDTSQYEQVIATYNTLSVAQREQVLDMLFTTNQPHYMGWKALMFLWFPDLLDANGNPIPRAANPAAENRMWFLEGAYARGVKLIWRGTTEPQYRYMDGNGLVWMTPGTETASAQLKARTIVAAESMYNIRVSMIDPVNEPDSDWWTSLQYGDVCMSKEQVVTYLRACRTALDAVGLNRIEIIPYDAGYSMRTEYLDYILASDVGAGLQHLGFHGYNPTDSSLQHWNSAVNVARGMKCYQTEWGDWTQTAPEQAHGQAMEYARRINQSIFQAKVSGWFDWEHAFIFDLTATGWTPHEAAYIIAQYSRFIDPGMRMIQTNDMWSNNGTMAFLAPGSGQRDFSFITFYPGATPVTVRYDLSTLPGVKLLRNARQTTADVHFQALSPAISGDSITVTLSPQSVTSFRVSVGGDGSTPPPDPTPDPANQAPTATGDYDYQGTLTGTFTIAAPGVLANDTDPDGDTLTAVLVNNYITSLGHLTLNADGSFSVEITSARSEGDILGFTYKAVDPSGAQSAETTVLITLHAAAPAPEPDPTPSTGTYYVDSAAGNDSWNGTSEATAWRTFANVNGRTFAPGNRILLKRGGSWNDTLWPLGSGSAGSPITLGAYGTGALPKINMQTRDYGILMRNMQYWVLENIEVAGGYPSVNNCGIAILNDAGGAITHFRLNNLVVHDVGGEYSIPFDRGGIYMGVGRINDVVIDGCTVYNIHSDAAIEVGGCDNIYSRSNGITIRNCTTYNTFSSACAGILPLNADNVLVEHNTVYGLDGIWTWNVTTATMQFNEVYNTTCFTGGDGGGIHIDYYCNDNTIQYNYIHDCGGYSTCVYGADTSNVGGTHAITKNGVIRYNILANNAREAGLAYQGDILVGTFSNGFIDGAKIYNNTIIANVNHGDGFVLNTGSAITNSIFKNNIVYSATPRLIRVMGGFTMDNNVYWLQSGTPQWNINGANYWSLASWQGTGQDAHSRYQNPLLGNAGYHTTGAWPTTQFALQPGSPAINAGANVGSMGSRDFLGNAIPQETAYDIGACESGGAGPAPEPEPDPEPEPQPTPNQAPTAAADLDYEGPLAGTTSVEAPGVLANDTDPDGDALTAVLVNNYATGIGSLTLNADGSFSFTPTIALSDGNIVGFTYKAVDPSGAESAEATVLITLHAAPEPEPATYTLTVNSGTGDGSYASGAQVTITADAPPQGQVFNGWTGDTGPLANATSATTTVTMPGNNVAVTATYAVPAPEPEPEPEPQPTPNQAPTAAADLDYEGPLNGTSTIDAPGVLANDTDPDGDALTAVLVNNYATGIGNLTLNADGSFSFTPTIALSDGNVVGFTYKAVDPSGAESAETTVLITLRASAPPEPDPQPEPEPEPEPQPEPEPGTNEAPAGYSDNYEAPLGETLSIDAPGVLANDTDADGDVLTAVLVNDYTAGLGNLTFNADGSFTFEPTYAYLADGDLVGFTYRAVDPSGAESSETTVLITLREAAEPEPQPDPAPTPEPQPQPDPAPQAGLPAIGGGSDLPNSSNGNHMINDTLCGGTIGRTGMPGLWIPLAGMAFAFWPRKRH